MRKTSFRLSTFQKISKVMKTLCGASFSKSTVSEVCKDLDRAVTEFRTRPLEGEYPFLTVDATYFKVRENSRIVSKAFMIAYGTNGHGHREILGFNVYSNESAATWIDFLIPEDNAVQDRISDTAFVDSEPLHFFLSIQHPRKAVRWWHARKLENPVRIAYVGSWTSDDQIKEALSVKINSTALITEMLFGDLSGADLVFAFRKPKDLTLQDRFCIEIMKNHPDRTIREHVRKELLRGNIEIPGVDLTKPDPLYEK